MTSVYLSIGSNVDRERHIQAALDGLAQLFGALVISSVYESEAVGFDGEPFYNLVVGIETSLPVGQLSRSLKDLEDANGRLRDVPRFSARTLDLDILTYGDAVGDHDGVSLPRGEILKNAFVLRPLAEIAGDEVHPQTGERYADHWARYDRAQRLWVVPFVWQGQSISPRP